MIRLSGQLICTNEQESALIARYLPDHVTLSRAEPGCLSFQVWQSENPLIWCVEESFADRAAFDLHQARTRQSLWFAATAHIRRDYRLIDG